MFWLLWKCQGQPRATGLLQAVWQCLGVWSLPMRGGYTLLTLHPPPGVERFWDMRTFREQCVKWQKHELPAAFQESQ